MRKIDKGVPIPSFSEFVSRTHPAKWEDAKDVRSTWRKYILECEQHYLSGYTEKPVSFESSHIDHFYKQSLFNDLIFDWNNLIVDAIDETYGAKYKDKVVNTKTDNEKLVNPVTEDAGRFFKYELTGKIDVADGLNDSDIKRATYTIDAFNLNEGSLVDRRKWIVNIILDSYQDLTDDMILDALKEVGFPSVVEQLLKERKKE